MKQKLLNKRLIALDGLRGFAMLLVFTSHTNIPNQSTWFSPFIYNLIFVSGGIGVAFLFVLSGFLMAYLYSQPSNNLEYLQKRYTRIFPLFLTSSIAMSLFTLQSKNILIQTLIFFSLAIFVHVIWVYVIKRTSNIVKRTLFLSFLILQAIVGISYFGLSQNSGVYDLSKITGGSYLLLTGLINSTLTFFVGDTFPLLDGVYWSLAAEVLFYILYPIVCVPVIAYLSTKNRVIKIFFLIALIPFFFGLARLLERIPSFTTIHTDYFYYFVGGMTLGYLYNKYGLIIHKLSKPQTKILSVSTFLLFIAIFVLLNIPKPSLNSFLMNILLTFPYTLIVAILLLPRSFLLTRIFSSKLLVYIGTVSYSIYLSHRWVINIMHQLLGYPSTAGQSILYILLLFFICLLFASVLYLLVERPYFMRTPVKKKPMINFAYKPSKKALIVIVCMYTLYSAITIFAYRTTLTYEHIHDSYYKSLTVSKSLNKKESEILEVERVKLDTEKLHTLFLGLPFFFIICFLLYESTVIKQKKYIS